MSKSVSEQLVLVRHKTKPLYKGNCMECGKEVIVSMVSPNRCWQELTGIWVRTEDGGHNVGLLCEGCMRFDSKKYGFGFGGGDIKNLDLWEAYLI